MIQDETLYRMIRNGDLTAFDTLYSRYQIRLYRFLLSYLKNEQEAEEVFHEAFLRILKSPDVDFENGTFQGWIFKVSRNLCLNRLRSIGRSENKIPELMIDACWSPETILADRENSQKLFDAMNNLAPAQAEMLRLKLLGLPEKEISEVLLIPIGTVKSRFYKIIQVLKGELFE